MHNQNFQMPNSSAGCTIVLKLTGSSCNMRCSYCYELDASNRFSAILEPMCVESIINRVLHFPEVRFLLHGGEPLLYPKPLMRTLLKIIKDQLPGRHSIQLQTNGTLIDDEWLEILAGADSQVAVSISLDPPSTQSLRMLPGKDYYPIVRDRIKLVLKYFGMAGIVSVAHQANITYFQTFMNELIDMGISYLTINKLR